MLLAFKEIDLNFTNAKITHKDYKQATDFDILDIANVCQFNININFSYPLLQLF